MQIVYGRHDLTGQVFGRLTALRPTAAESTEATWLCQCECGNRKAVRSSTLRNGTTRSCGCLRAEQYESRKGKPCVTLPTLPQMATTRKGHKVVNLRYASEKKSSAVLGEIPEIGPETHTWSRRGLHRYTESLDIFKYQTRPRYIEYKPKE